MVSGNTSYDITYSGYDANYGNYTGESILVFNLNALMLDVGEDFIVGKRDFVLSVDYASSLTGFSQYFQDEDFFNNSTYNASYGSLISNTVSPGVDTPAQIFCLSLKPWLTAFGPDNIFKLNLELGYEHQHWGIFNVYNYSGYHYQYFTGTGNAQYVDVNSSSPVLTYEIFFDSYFIGLGVNFDISRGLRGEIGARTAICGFNDIDNHLFRDKLCRATGLGFSSDLRAELTLDLGKGYSLTGYGRYQDFSVFGTQAQTDYSGTVQPTPYLPISGTANDQVTSQQLRIGFEISYAFNFGRNIWGLEF